jgi:PII-like signaling protein
VSHDSLKLTIYFGENDSAGGTLLADALLGAFGRHRLETSVLLRGAEGFGIKHRLHSQRLLTLSEDLPLVALAVDTSDRIEAALDDVGELVGDGLVTLERARLPGRGVGNLPLPDDLREATKLTVYCGRQERAGGRPAFVAVVDLLRRHGVAGATVLLGVDGTARGERRRARFLGRNADVPLMILSVGEGERIAAVLPELEAMLADPLLTLERIRVCRRDGTALAAPAELPASDAEGSPLWQKLMVYSSEQARHAGRPLHLELVRRLRQAGAAGATCLRGIWGYHGDHPPHGDRLLSLRRHVPVVTVIVDDPVSTRRWFEIASEVTAESGLVTSELVPAARASGPAGARGTLRLARHSP